MATNPIAPRIAPVDLPLEDFPASTVPSDGAHVVDPDFRPRRAQLQLGVKYAVKDGRPLHLHLLFPPGHDSGSSPVPIVVFVQGSAWFEQQHGHSLLPMAAIAERGFAVVMVEYRPSPVAAFPAQIRDLNTALSYVRTNAASWGCDGNQLVLWGDSSGGHTVSLAALAQHDPGFFDESPPTQTPDGEAPEAGSIACVVDYFGPVDIALMSTEPSTMDHGGPRSPEGMLIGGHNVDLSPELVGPTVVTGYIDPSREAPPFPITHGTKDRLVPFGQSVLLWRALQEAGHEARFYRLEGADHGGEPFWAPSFLDLVEAFIRAHVAG